MPMPIIFFQKTNKFLIIKCIGIIHPAGGPISLHRLCCNPFVVVYYNFMGCGLAAEAISTRE